MHLSTLSHHLQPVRWSVTDLNLNILRNVGKGWSSGAKWRARDWPFWSYQSCLFGWNWVGIVGVRLLYDTIRISSRPTT